MHQRQVGYNNCLKRRCIKCVQVDLKDRLALLSVLCIRKWLADNLLYENLKPNNRLKPNNKDCQIEVGFTISSFILKNLLEVLHSMSNVYFRLLFYITYRMLPWYHSFFSPQVSSAPVGTRWFISAPFPKNYRAILTKLLTLYLLVSFPYFPFLAVLKKEGQGTSWEEIYRRNWE